MNGDMPDSGLTITGPIKWFDPIKGFGFLADPSGGQDVLLHANVLRNFGQGSVAEGALVQVRVAVTQRGRQAAEVISITPPPTGREAPIADLSMIPPDELAGLPLLPARVKWFDKGKGFGFANVFGQRGDIFLHVEVLRHCGFADLLAGEAIALRIVDGPRGVIAAQIVAWDRAAAEMEAESCASAQAAPGVQSEPTPGGLAEPVQGSRDVRSGARSADHSAPAASSVYHLAVAPGGRSR